MQKSYKIVVSAFALLFSVCAACLGYVLVGNSSLNLSMRFVYDFFFIMQFLATLWIVIMIFSKSEEKK